MGSLNYYRKLFSSLQVNNKNKPYRPILLLSIIDLIAQGYIQENKIFVDDIFDTFEKYRSILAPEHKGGIYYPFIHLQSKEFWHVKFKPNFNGLQPKSVTKLKEVVEYATLDDELFDFFQDDTARQELIDILLFEWFLLSKNKEEKILELNNLIQDSESTKLIKIENLIKNENKKKVVYKKNTVIRSSFFRQAIIYLYDYKCSLCGLQVFNSLSQALVDGAHIKPFSQFYDNRVDNGISLCKNHHWAFDNGLFAIDNDYQIIVANNFQEKSPNSRHLKEFNGEKLLLPISKLYYPNLAAIEWHRQNVFKSE